MIVWFKVFFWSVGVEWEEVTETDNHQLLRVFQYDLLSKAEVCQLLAEKNISTLSEDWYLNRCNDDEFVNVDEIFNAFHTKHKGQFFSFHKWGHIDVKDIEYLWIKFYVNRDALIEYGTRYLKTQKAYDEKIDLMIVDMLMFAELLAIYENIQRALSEYDYQNANLIILVGLVRFGIKFYLATILTKSFDKANIAYHSITVNDWEVLWQDVQHSRRQGIIWDKLVFDLIQRNLPN